MWIVSCSCYKDTVFMSLVNKTLYWYHKHFELFLNPQDRLAFQGKSAEMFRCPGLFVCVLRKQLTLPADFWILTDWQQTINSYLPPVLLITKQHWLPILIHNNLEKGVVEIWSADNGQDSFAVKVYYKPFLGQELSNKCSLVIKCGISKCKRFLLQFIVVF